MSKSLCITGVDVVTPFRVIRDGVVVTDGAGLEQVGTPEAVAAPATCERLHLPGRKVLPGFVDLHIHGIAGCDFDRADSDAFEAAAAALLSHGTTAALITLVPAPPDLFFPTLARVRSYLDRTDRNPVFCGIHAEGPFLNPEMHGALRPDCMWLADNALATRLFEAAGHWLKLMTIAPELADAMAVIRRAVRQGVVISVGHSRATYADIEHAIDNGLTQVTHIFNAMPLAHHRDPGVLGAAYTHQELKVQLIADGVHVHPAVMRFLVKVKGTGGILLVSDATPASGLPDGDYEFDGRAVRLRNGIASQEDGTLAGDALTLDGAVRNMVNLCGISLGDAARMAGLNPARVLKMDDHKGILAAGHDADFVVLDSNLKPELTVKDGNIVYRAGSQALTPR